VCDECDDGHEAGDEKGEQGEAAAGHQAKCSTRLIATGVV
jgi:hypothetical protein